MNPSDDWIKLAVKFKGRCNICGKDVNAGDTAFWSKKTKAIRHIGCHLPDDKAGSQSLSASEIACFICGRQAECMECDFEPNCDRIHVSQACICTTCMDQGEPYYEYQKAFKEKLHKIQKVKI
jgi:hypothetical protein